MSSKYADILTKNDKNKDHIMINKNLKPMTSNKIEYQDMYTDATTKQTNLSNELKNDQQFKILIDEIELQLKIATGCYDYKLCHIVFLCTENNNGFRQQFHTDWNGSNDLINDEAEQVGNNGNFLLFSFEGNDHDYFIQQQLSKRVAHMAVTIEDFEKINI